MPIKIHDLKPAAGSKKPKRRVGRGIAGKGGKTAGRGTKGQGARDNIKPGFEGGQTPLHLRTPIAKGFHNPFKVSYEVINVEKLADFAAGSTVDPDTLRAKSLVPKKGLIKVLGNGELSVALTVKAHKFSRSAQQAIEAAGGSVELIPLPWGDRRPPARGSAHTNR